MGRMHPSGMAGCRCERHFPPAPEGLQRCRCHCRSVRLDESLCTSRDGSHKRNWRQDRTVDLFRLGNRQQEPFPRLLEGRTLEHNDAVGPGARREPTRSDPVVLDRNRLGLDRLLMLVFRCHRKLYLRRQYFNSPRRRVPNGERHGHLLLFLYRLPYRNLQLLAFPMWILNPFRPEQILLLSSRLLWGSAGWLIFCSNVFCFANHKRGMSRRNQKAARALTVEDIVHGLTTI